MIHRIFVVLVLFVPIVSSGQDGKHAKNQGTPKFVDFEKGYFVDGGGNRIECNIKNEKWDQDPKKFHYIMPGGSTVLTGTLEGVKEFSVIGKVKYIRATVDIDVSDYRMMTLSISPFPEWSREQIFLEVLVEGKAMLYYCRRNYGNRFFYSMDTSSIRQLVYKKYYLKGKENVGTNKEFQNQLRKDLVCEGSAFPGVGSLGYYRGELTNLFMRFNECHGEVKAHYNSSYETTLFRLSIRPGISYSSLQIRNNGVPGDGPYEFPSRITMRFGVEAEINISAKKKTWTIIVEPTYRSYTAMSTVAPGADVNYQSVEIPIGLRFHFPSRTKLNFFVNGGVVVDIPFEFTHTFYHRRL